jgi:glutamate-1-semialdehyde 2,1-aminomutase
MSDLPDIVQRAARVFPGGVLGSHRNGPGLEFVVREARGAYLWDTNGRRYIDYLLGSGPMLLGHAHPKVVEAVRTQVAAGTTYMLLNEPIIALAEEVVRAVACAEQVRFTSSGSEATFFALRVARAYRGREKVLKFEGGWHGTHDYGAISVSTRSPKAFPAPTFDSGGIPHGVGETVLVAPYNDLATTEALIAAHHNDLAAVIVEPYQRTIVPVPGFLAGLRDVTRRYGVPLVFDEIVTGFRLAYGGAQEYYGVVPDLATFGKVLAGGFPLGAVCGRAEIMRHFDPALEGTPAELRKPGTYERLHRMGTRLRDGLAAAARRHALPARVSGEPPVFDILFTDRDVVDYRATLMADRERIRRFNDECLRRGVVKAVNKIYVSLALTDADVEATLGVFDEALAAVAKA